MTDTIDTADTLITDTLGADTIADKAPQNTDTAISKLNPRHKDFVQRYTDPNSDTYGNGTRTYQAIYGKDKSDNVAAAASSKLLTKCKIRNAIEEICARQHLDNEVSIAALADIVHGKYTQVATAETTDKHGNTVSTTTTRSTPRSTDIIKAIDLVNKMTGLYAQQSIDADIAMREYESLRKRHLA